MHLQKRVERVVRTISGFSIVVALVAGGPVLAQNQAAGDEPLEEITVTGSYIRGSSTTGALPISVVSRSDIEDLGAPTTTDIVNNMVINTGSENRSNALGGQNRNTGTANVNLRGLGLDKTLVLFNGKRQAIHSTSAGSGASFVDINLIPGIALDRVEVLKDGAAATYGSDAVAGVVNFFTRNTFEGIELSSSYRDRAESPNAPSWDISGLWGWANDTTNLTVAAAFTRVEQLNAADMPFASLVNDSILNANRGVSSLAAPGAFIPLANPAAGFFNGAPLAGLPLIANDPASPAPDCGPEGLTFNALGGTADIGTPPIVGRCGYSFVKHFNLADDQSKVNFWSTLQTDVGDRAEFYAEAAYYAVDVENIGNSPSFPVLRFVVMPAAHPANPHGVPGIYLGRPYGQSQSTQTSWRDYETYRFVGGFKGEMGNGWEFDTSVSYSSNNVKESSPTVIQQRFADAINGLGGPNCDTATGTPGVGSCLWFNPFSTRFTTIPNDPSIEPFMRSTNDLDQTADLLVVDAVFNGDLFETGAGTVRGAFGVQYRDESLDVNRNLEATIPGTFVFIGGGIEVDQSQDAYALFGELAIPLAENFEAQVALRYEDYGSQIGDTIDPKLAVLWTVNDVVSLRASASTTFRAPTLHQRFNQETNLIPFADVPVGGGSPSTGFKAAETTGNPNLKPEEATTFNVGLVVEGTDNLRFTLDYWNIDFDDVIAIENGQTKVTIENTLCVNRTPDCRDPDIFRNPANATEAMSNDNLQHSGEITRVIVPFINAPTVKTDGIDVSAIYNIPTASANEFMLGLDASYMLNYDIGGIPGVVGGSVTSVEIDAVGNRNESNIGSPLPQWRANFTVGWNNDQHSARAILRHIDDYKDDKTAAQTFNSMIDSYTTVDLYYNYAFANEKTVLALNVTNIADEDPPFADQDLNFEARTHDPFGRQYQVVLRHNFDL